MTEDAVDALLHRLDAPEPGAALAEAARSPGLLDGCPATPDGAAPRVSSAPASDGMTFYGDGAKDRDTRRMVVRWRKSGGGAPPGRRVNALPPSSR